MNELSQITTLDGSIEANHRQTVVNNITLANLRTKSRGAFDFIKREIVSHNGRIWVNCDSPFVETAPIHGDAMTVLVVDDDKIDQMAVRRSFTKLNISNPIVGMNGGFKALDFLRARNGQGTIAGPCLVLLDLHMPRMDGIEFLAELSVDPSLRSTLVFLMTTTADEEKWLDAHAMNIVGYMRKDRPAHNLLTAIGAMTHQVSVSPLRH
jgi:CheY-like chemotaxis protein